jgi:hypothetical protein
MDKVIVGDGMMWVRVEHLDAASGQWVEMPRRYDPQRVTEDDIAHDYAIRRLTDAEVVEAESRVPR